MSTATTTPDSERRKVVIALDSSKESKNALAWALDNLVQVDKDHLILLTVGVFADKWSDIVSAALGPAYSRDEKLEKAAEEYAMNILDEATKIINEHSTKLNKTAKISHEIYALKAGDPRDVIVDFCRDAKVDLLVMGSRGIGAVKRALMGSTSAYCVHNAPCPVVVCRDKGEQ